MPGLSTRTALGFCGSGRKWSERSLGSTGSTHAMWTTTAQKRAGFLPYSHSTSTRVLTPGHKTTKFFALAYTNWPLIGLARKQAGIIATTTSSHHIQQELVHIGNLARGLSDSGAIVRGRVKRYRTERPFPYSRCAHCVTSISQVRMRGCASTLTDQM
jgi:hypothetical protein